MWIYGARKFDALRTPAIAEICCLSAENGATRLGRKDRNRTAVDLPSSTAVKWVDASYIHESGIQRRMHDAGYMCGWTSDAWLKRWIDEGWELVLERDGVGSLVKVRMRIDGGKLTLVMKKWAPAAGAGTR